MKLFFRKYGSGQPLIILHGLFGQSDNWNTLAKQFGEAGFETYAVDQRNHGLSPWSDEWNYNVMSEDVLELINDNQLKDVILLGHSMGGKTAMQLALDHPEKIGKLVVADMAPKAYTGHNDKALEGLLSVDLSKINSRKEAEEQLAKRISDYGTKQFLLKNLYRKEDEGYDWRFNLKVISENYAEAGKAITGDGKKYEGPALFVRGGNSAYVKDEDLAEIRKLFPKAALDTIQGAGHWVHAEKPKEFFEAVKAFIKKKYTDDMD